MKCVAIFQCGHRCIATIRKGTEDRYRASAAGRPCSRCQEERLRAEDDAMGLPELKHGGRRIVRALMTRQRFCRDYSQEDVRELVSRVTDARFWIDAAPYVSTGIFVRLADHLKIDKKTITLDKPQVAAAVFPLIPRWQENLLHSDLGAEFWLELRLDASCGRVSLEAFSRFPDLYGHLQ